MRISCQLALAALLLLGNIGAACAEELMGDMGAFASSQSAGNATTIDAQRLEMYLDREMRAFGDAEVHSDGQIIKGDRIDFNPINRELHATGNVRLEQANSIADGTELRLKLEDREGEMTDPVFHLGVNSSKKSRGSARTLFFEGPTKERLKSARYTTCEDGRDDWFLRAGELEIDHHTETATATNASVEFKGVPILYTPWIDFPFNNQRKSGLLSPTWGTTTRNGFEFSLPYYWNIGPNMDATITPRHLGKRGLQWQGEYRYLDTQYQGINLVEFLPNDSQTGDNRYFANLTHSQDFGSGWSGSLHYERASDSLYFTDMSTKTSVTSRTHLPQAAQLGYSSTNWHFSALAQQYQTLDKKSYPYQRLPQLTLTGQETLGILDTSLYSEFVRFDYGDEGQAYFKAVNGVKSLTANRFTLYPSLSLPLANSFGFVTPKVGIHYTNYGLQNAGANIDEGSRVLPIFSLDSGVYFDRDMRVVKNNYTHTLEPRIFYVYIPYQDQTRLPIFDSGLSDINLGTLFTENQYSGNDRVNDANQVTLSLTSRLIDQKTGAQRLSATLAERFYFNDQRVIHGGARGSNLHSDIFAALTAQLLNGWYADATWQYNTDTNQIPRGNVTARYQPEPGKILNLAYRFTRDSSEQIDVSTEWPLGGNWYGLGRLNYSLSHNSPTDKRGPIEYLAGLEYNAGCWQGRAVMQRLPITNTSTTNASANYAMFFQLELGGLSSIGTSPFEVLKRNIPGYTSTNLIPDAPR